MGKVLSILTSPNEDLRRWHPAIESRPEPNRDSLPMLLIAEAPRCNLCHHGHYKQELYIQRIFAAQEPEEFVSEALWSADSIKPG